MNLNFPTGTDHTGRTMDFSIRNKKSEKLFELSGPNAQITVASEQIAIAVPSATTDAENVALSSLETSECEYGFDVRESSGTLVARFQGNIQWPSKRGMFNES